MPYEIPKPLTGNVREDIRQIWDTLFRLTEQLRLAEAERERKEAGQ